MAKDWEQIFTNWTKPPSDTEDARCSNAVSMIKNAVDSDSLLKKMRISVFAQGSYANNTNVRLNSDVDVSICNNDYLFCDYPVGKSDSDYGNNDSNYTFSDFKNQVQIALENYFGKSHVVRGNKAFDIKSNTYRVEADAVPCFEHRRYTGSSRSYHSGTEFIADDRKRIINWPNQHLNNGVQKNKETSLQFKKVVRILKRLNIEMRDNNVDVANRIPSFLIECLCWNTSNSVYGYSTYTAMVKELIRHLFHSTNDNQKVNEWGEINELKYLFRLTQPWTLEDAHDWTSRVWNYLGFTG